MAHMARVQKDLHANAKFQTGGSTRINSINTSCRLLAVFHGFIPILSTSLAQETCGVHVPH